MYVGVMEHLQHVVIKEMDCWLEFALKRKDVITENPTVIAAVSGGKDSMAMLDALYVLKKWLTKWQRSKIVVCHVDHGLRSASARDALFVEEITKSYGFHFCVYKACGKDLGENTESWARKIRYGFLNQCLKEQNGDVILTAHHASDQAETLLWRVITGRLLSSSYCIGRFNNSLRVLRPFLSVTKRDMFDYVKQRNIKYVFDETNAQISYTRNRIRAELIPELIEKYNPNIEVSLAKLAQKFSNDEDTLLSSAQAVAHEFLARKDGKLESLAQIIKTAPNSYKWRVVRFIANDQLSKLNIYATTESMCHPFQELSYEAASRIVDVLENDKFDANERIIELGCGMRFLYSTNLGFRFDIDKLARTKNHFKPICQSLDYKCLELPSQTNNEVKELISRNFHNGLFCKIEASICEYNNEDSNWSKEIKNDPFGESVAYFDFNQPQGDKIELMGRFRANGDSMRVWKRGTRKVKKLMSEARLPIELRDQIPIVFYRESIIWVSGVARCDAFAVNEKSRLIVRLRYLRGRC